MKKDPFRNPFPRETLFWAVWRRNLGEVAEIIAAGADVEETVEDDQVPYLNPGSRAMHLAARKGHMGIVEYLAGCGADVDVVDYHDTTPLHCAAVNGRVHVVEFFLEKGADPNAQDWQGRTPLHLAVLGDHPRVIAVLREDSRTVVGICDYCNRTPLSVAMVNKRKLAEAALMR